MPTTSSVPARRHRCIALLAALAVGMAASGAPALAQDGGEPPTTEPSTTTTAPPVTEPPGEPTTTTTLPIDPEDPGAVEELPEEPVPVVPDTVPPRAPGAGEYGVQVGRIVRQQLRVAAADAVELETTYKTMKQRLVDLETELDRLETSVTGLATGERAAVRRVEAARRKFEARTVSAVVRGRSDDLGNLIVTDDPNEIAIAQALLSSVLAADDLAVREYLAAKQEVSAELVGVAERLADARIELEGARVLLVETRRASVAAQFNLAVFAAGSEIVIHGFVFPVGDPHSFGDSFGAPRMMGTGYEHAHQGTDIMAPAGTPLMACERGIITEMGSDVLGGTKLWLKGESGTYYYYAHLSAFAEGLAVGDVVDAGEIVGLVGDTGNARGGAPHLHFEIHPDGGMAVNPYALLKVVDDLREDSKASGALGQDQHVDVVASVEAPCTPAALYPWVDDLVRYPDWLDIVPRAVVVDPHPDDVGPAWSVNLRGRLGPFARAKRLRMVRTAHDVDRHARFERTEHDGRQHSPWVLDATVAASPGGSTLTMRLHYGGRLWMPALDRLLADEIERSRPRLLRKLES